MCNSQSMMCIWSDSHAILSWPVTCDQYMHPCTIQPHYLTHMWQGDMIHPHASNCFSDIISTIALSATVTHHSTPCMRPQWQCTNLDWCWSPAHAFAGMQRVGSGWQQSLVLGTVIHMCSATKYFHSLFFCAHRFVCFRQQAQTFSIQYHTFPLPHFLLPPWFRLFQAWWLTLPFIWPSGLCGGGASCTLSCIPIWVDTYV